MEGIVQSYGDSKAGTGFMDFHEFWSTVSIDFCIMILTSIIHIFPPSSLNLDFQSLPGAWLDLCIWFHKLLNEGPVQIVGLFML